MKTKSSLVLLIMLSQDLQNYNAALKKKNPQTAAKSLNSEVLKNRARENSKSLSID